jgi:hypothetical protein
MIGANSFDIVSSQAFSLGIGLKAFDEDPLKPVLAKATLLIYAIVENEGGVS